MYLQLKLSACFLLISFRLCDSIGGRSTPKRVCSECHVHYNKCDNGSGCPPPIQSYDRYHPNYPVQHRTPSRKRPSKKSDDSQRLVGHAAQKKRIEYILYVKSLRSAKMLYKMLKPVTSLNPPMNILIKLRKDNRPRKAVGNVKPKIQTKSKKSGKSDETQSNKPKKRKMPLKPVKQREMNLLRHFNELHSHKETIEHKTKSTRALITTAMTTTTATAATATMATTMTAMPTLPRRTTVPRPMIISDDSIELMPPEREHTHEEVSTRTEPKLRSVLMKREPRTFDGSRQSTLELTDKIIDYGFLLKIRYNNHSICTGALISPRLVLTSAHCFHATPTAALELKVETNFRHEAAVAEVISKGDNELAFLVLQQPINQLKPIPLCAEALQLDDSVIMLTAKGELNATESRPSHVISNVACKLSYLRDEEALVTADMICVHNVAIAKSCTTGVGDALLRNGRLCGVNMYGANCRDYVDNGDLYVNIYKLNELVRNVISKYDLN